MAPIDAFDELLRDPSIAPHLDRAVDRIASKLDPTDTDAGGEHVGNIIREHFATALADLATGNGWRTP